MPFFCLLFRKVCNFKSKEVKRMEVVVFLMQELLMRGVAFEITVVLVWCICPKGNERLLFE